jgi:hypothetical protein
VRQAETKKWCPGAESNHRHEDFQSDEIIRDSDYYSNSKITVPIVLAQFGHTYGLERPNLRYLGGDVCGGLLCLFVGECATSVPTG